MSKNVLIAEGRRGRRFGAVKKLRTNLQGGGNCLWVPEEEVELEPLYAYENGVYRPDKYGFDSASINVVDASLTPLDTGHNIPSFPPAGTDGFSQVTVNVPEEEQDIYMDAVQLKCVGIPSGKPYMLVLLADRQSTSFGYRESNKVMTYYYSAFPFYVQWVMQNNLPYPRIYTFARGSSSLRAVMNFDLNLDPNRTYDTNSLDHAYCHNLILEYGDGFDTNSASAPSTIRTKMDHNVDVIPTLADWCTLIDEGEHLGSATSQAGSVSILKQNSTIPSEEVIPTPADTKFRTQRSVWACFPPRSGTGDYSFNYDNTKYADYRIINNKSFATIEDWFLWCKTH